MRIRLRSPGGNVAWLVAAGGEAEIAPGIDRCAVDAHLVVDMWPGDAPADAHVADHLAALHALTRLSPEAGKVSVPGGDAKAVVHDHQPAVSGPGLDRRHHPLGARAHRIAVLRGDVHAGVECAFTAERV